MNDKRQDITQEQVRLEKPSTRFLYGCGLVMRQLAIGIRPAVIEIILTRNGFGKGEAAEMLDQTKARWDAMTPKRKEEIKGKVRMRQFLRETGLRRR